MITRPEEILWGAAPSIAYRLEPQFTIHIGCAQNQPVDTPVLIWDAPPDVTFPVGGDLLIAVRERQQRARLCMRESESESESQRERKKERERENECVRASERER